MFEKLLARSTSEVRTNGFKPTPNSMTIAIISLHDHNMRDVAALSYPNFHRYCCTHDYLFRGYEGTLDEMRHPAWSKIRAMQIACSEGLADWICWIDCDALFMNHTVKLEQYINPAFRILFCRDFNGLATGLILAQACNWTIDFFQAVYLCGDCEDKNPDGHGHKREQNTVKLLLRNFPDLQRHCGLINDPASNRHYIQSDFRSGDFILQFPCMPNSERIMAMREMANQIVYTNNKICD